MKLRNRKRTKTPVGKNLRHSLHLVKQERGGRNRTAGILSWQETERGSEGLDFQSDACITFLILRTKLERKTAPVRISPHGRYLYIYKVISLLCVLYAVVQFSLLRVIPAVHRPHKIACDAANPLKLHAFPGALRIANVVVFHIPSSSRPLYIVPLFQRKIKMDPSFYRPATERKIFSKTTETLPASTFSVVQNVSSGFVVIR